jgi:hypothetical protein
MTGDGTNDAAAIRLADVGIGVAAAGSSSSWSAADLILADAGVEHIHDARWKAVGSGTGSGMPCRSWSAETPARWPSWSSAPRCPAGPRLAFANCCWSTC